MSNFKLTIAYDGTMYYGWQVQPGVPTIQGEIQRVLARVLGHDAAVFGSGRTDRGVHASGQVAHFSTGRPMAPDTLSAALNALLPPDIRILRVERASDTFHARYSALSKTYAYHVWRHPVVSPFRSRYAHAIWSPLDSAAMEGAAERIRGVHDFTSFSSAPAQARDCVRRVLDAGWERGDDEWIFRIRATGFLRYMVRTIVGTLLDVGAGRTPPDEIDAILDARSRARAGETAPACGLILVEVEYPVSDES